MSVGRVPRRVLLFNPNSTTAITERMAAIAGEVLGEGWRVSQATNPDAPSIIVDETGAEYATGTTIKVFEQGLDPLEGVILSAFIDPALDELRASLPVPVVGIAQSAMDAAARYGAFVILSPTPQLAGAMERMAERYGHASKLSGIVNVEGDPLYNISNAADLLDGLRVLLDRAIETFDAKAAIVGGGPLVDVARKLGEAAPLPIIEPVPEAARALKNLIEAKD